MAMDPGQNKQQNNQQDKAFNSLDRDLIFSSHKFFLFLDVRFPSFRDNLQIFSW
jgi:hypothetical protein